MMHAYQEIYLKKAQAVLGDAFDYAINTCGICGNDFLKMFVISEICKRMEKGEAKYLVGKSGIELAREIVEETSGKQLTIEPQENFFHSPEYWVGWAVAYYQWWSARKYVDIFRGIAFEDLQALYYTLHEADIIKFVEAVEDKVKAFYADTNLKRIRGYYGCTQEKLAELSGISLHSIQRYEQKKGTINNARASVLYAITKVLGCSIEDLLECESGIF